MKCSHKNLSVFQGVPQGGTVVHPALTWVQCTLAENVTHCARAISTPGHVGQGGSV